jgi:hypothetical protein
MEGVTLTVVGSVPRDVRDWGDDGVGLDTIRATSGSRSPCGSPTSMWPSRVGEEAMQNVLSPSPWH